MGRMQTVARDPNCLAIAFARHASANGWNRNSLRRFCADHGISRNERRWRWPAGVRTLGWQLNAVADRRMLDSAKGAPRASMGEIFASRFAQNRELKPAVARLALSDLVHPIDTLKRTKRTADLMWLCYGGPRSSNRIGRDLDTWLLVLVYSLCVVVWLLDTSSGDRITGRTTRAALLMIGLR